jgi:hypothetical protein
MDVDRYNVNGSRPSITAILGGFPSLRRWLDPGP